MKYYFILLLFSVITIVSFYNSSINLIYNQYRAASKINHSVVQTIPETYKSILYWDTFHGAKDMGIGLGHEIFQNCSVTTCVVTNDKSYMPVEQYDAIIFHSARFSVKKHGLPANRTLKQKYIFYSMESAFNTYFEKRVNNYFYNWTMSYKRDSDIWSPYAVIKRQRTLSYMAPNKTNMQAKTNKVAWMVSNCHSKGTARRMRFVKELQKYIPVDIYGKCGPLQCNDREKCYEMIEKDYKFYLAFENSMCEDYVTEKLYNTLKLNIIPVGLSFVDYKSIAPPHSVINANDFINPKHLATYLWKLDSNHTEYLKYFAWKKDYVVDDSRQFVLCQLCEKLHQPLKNSVYPDVQDWYWGFGCVV